MTLIFIFGNKICGFFLTPKIKNKKKEEEAFNIDLEPVWNFWIEGEERRSGGE